MSTETSVLTIQQRARVATAKRIAPRSRQKLTLLRLLRHDSGEVRVEWASNPHHRTDDQGRPVLTDIGQTIIRHDGETEIASSVVNPGDGWAVLEEYV